MTRIEYDGVIDLKRLNETDIKDIIFKFVTNYLKNVAMDRDTIITNINKQYRREVGSSNLYRILRELEEEGVVQKKRVGNRLYYYSGD